MRGKNNSAIKMKQTLVDKEKEQDTLLQQVSVTFFQIKCLYIIKVLILITNIRQVYKQFLRPLVSNACTY